MHRRTRVARGVANVAVNAKDTRVFPRFVVRSRSDEFGARVALQKGMSPAPKTASTALPSTAQNRRGSGAFRIDLPRVAAEPPSEWDRLVETWDALGYDGPPPTCMAAYADDVIEAFRS